MKTKVLAIDDESFTLMLLKELLREEDYLELDTCKSADEGIELLKKNHYSLVLLDIILPGIDGFEARHIIRRNFPKLPIIFITALIDTIDNDFFRKISEDNLTFYLQKPFNRIDLINTVRNALKLKNDEDKDSEEYNGLLKDLQLAADVQQLLIPDWFITNEDMVVASLYEPIKQVSGDVFDIFKISEHKYFFFLGDISGHGIQAALYMSAIQSALRVLVQSGELQPHELLNRLNKMFSIDLGQNHYMTCLSGIFDFAANKLFFFNAGHPPPAELNPNTGKINILGDDNSGNIPVGWDQKSKYMTQDSITHQFSDDSIFLFYTDGLMELSDRHDNIPAKDKIQEIASGAAVSKEFPALPYIVRSALEQLGFDRINDDICVLLLRKNIIANDKKIFARLIAPSANEIGKLCHDCEAFVRDTTGNSEAAAKTELLLGEFLNNVIIHGLGKIKGARPGIYVSVQTETDNVIIKIFDKGKKWVLNTEALHSSPEIAVENEKFATSGRGMQIIRSIASEIKRERFRTLNQTIFKIKIIKISN